MGEHDTPAETPANETSPLLARSTGSSETLNGRSTERTTDVETGSKYVDTQKSEFRLVVSEFFILMRGSIPVFVAYALQNGMQAISILIVGRTSAENLAVAAFSFMWAVATGWLLALGGTTALDTLCSSAFTGSSNPYGLGILLQRSFVVLGAFYIPIILLWSVSEPIFLALGQQPEIAAKSARFLWVLLPGGLGYVYFECMKKYLQAQGFMRAGTYVLLITAPVNAGLNYLFIYTLEMGLLGAPFATGISYWLSFFMLVGYCKFIGGSACWGGWDLKAACRKREVGIFAKLAILGIFHVGTEWWAFEIVTLVAGALGTLPLAAQSVIATSDEVFNTLPFGVGIATSARVGNLLGSKDARGAARAANTAPWLSIFLGGIVSAILFGTKDNFARLFTDDEEVVQLTAKVLPLVALFQIADGLAGSNGGSLRGMGRQKVGAAANLISYYCGALPTGIALAFNGWGLQGLWLGNCIALYLTGLSQWFIVTRSDWDKQVKNAFKRMDHSHSEENGAPANGAPANGTPSNGTPVS